MKSALLNAKTSLLSLAVVICINVYSQKVPFVNSTVVPGAEGTVKVKQDKNNNFTIDVSIINLAEPKQLTPPKKAYVAWIETDHGTKNMGQVNSSNSLLSKTRKASLTTISTFKPKRFFITAEEDAKVDSPGTQTVLTTNPF